MLAAQISFLNAGSSSRPGESPLSLDRNESPVRGPASGNSEQELMGDSRNPTPVAIDDARSIPKARLESCSIDQLCDDREVDRKFECLGLEFVLEWFVQIIGLGAQKTANADQAVLSRPLAAGIGDAIVGLDVARFEDAVSSGGRRFSKRCASGEPKNV
jgi:hypothetical protein